MALSAPHGRPVTHALQLYSAVRFGLTPAVNALATIMLGVTLAAVILTAVVLRRSRRRVTADPRSTVQPALGPDWGSRLVWGGGPANSAEVENLRRAPTY